MDAHGEQQRLSLPKRLEEQFCANPLMAAVKLARFKFPARMLSPADDVLDLGCGVGYGAYFYASQTKGQVLGLDAYADLDYAQAQLQRENLSFQRADLRDPPAELLRRRFDAIISVDVIEHFMPGDGERIIANFGATLRDGGMMILGSPNVLSGPYRSEQSKSVHVHEYEPDELQEVCRRHFARTFLFSMNDEVVHTGFSKMAWFFYVVAVGFKGSRER